MYKTLATINGALIALMITFNALLASHIGSDQSLITIHLIGLLGTIILLLGSRTKLKSLRGLPIYLFLGGALGIFNVLFNNLCFGVLGATITLSLNLIGQLVASMLLDHFGLFGLSINRINRGKMIGVSIMILGIISMILI